MVFASKLGPVVEEGGKLVLLRPLRREEVKDLRAIEEASGGKVVPVDPRNPIVCPECGETLHTIRMIVQQPGEVDREGGYTEEVFDDAEPIVSFLCPECDADVSWVLDAWYFARRKEVG